MVDEKLLKDINDVLKKIEILKDQDNIGETLAEYGIDILSLDENGIIDAISKFLLTDAESICYERYKAYIKQKKLNDIVDIIGSLNGLTTNVDKLYEERRKLSSVIFNIDEVIHKITMKLHDVPMIRISSLYGHVENDYHNYSSTVIKLGMDESRMNDTIYNIERGSLLLRRMKAKDLERLKKELALFKEKSEKDIKEKHDRYDKTREEYTTLLGAVVMEFLRNDLFLNAAVLTINDLFGGSFKTEIDSLGIERVVKEDLDEVTSIMVVSKFFDYFEQHNDDNYDAKTFYNLLESFFLHHYVKRKQELDGKRNKCLLEISKAFNNQKEIMMKLTQSQLELGSIADFSDDEKDTFSLVHRKKEK